MRPTLLFACTVTACATVPGAEAPAAAATPYVARLVPARHPMLPGAGEQAKASAFPESFTAQEIWVARCAMCHGVEGDGRGHPAYGARNVTSPEWQDARTDGEILGVIMDGIADTRMRGFRTKATVEQLEGLVALIRTLRGTAAQPPPPP